MVKLIHKIKVHLFLTGILITENKFSESSVPLVLFGSYGLFTLCDRSTGLRPLSIHSFQALETTKKLYKIMYIYNLYIWLTD